MEEQPSKDQKEVYSVLMSLDSKRQHHKFEGQHVMVQLELPFNDNERYKSNTNTNRSNNCIKWDSIIRNV